MRAAVWIIGLLGAGVITSTKPVSAADLRPSVDRSSIATVTPEIAAPKVRRRVHRRTAVYRTRSAILRRTIGMPCILPPDVIVQLNWNGPQCRWIDNIIPGDERTRLIKIHRSS
jgi:hypothetical protein